PPSASRSPSPGPQENGKIARQSMGPGSRGTGTLAPASPRPGARPTSEVLGVNSAGMFQTPEAEALDQWFENLQNYEATLEDMAAASLDVNFKEELSAIEQWFKVLSEAERTAALYSLLQHSTQVQIRFFITVLQQMARSDPMTALLSPAMGSMQSQMEAKLATLKSPGLKSGLPASPTARNFSGPLPGNRQSMIIESSSNSNFLSPDSAAETLVQQRAKLKASNAAHRISAPVLSTGAPTTWASATAASLNSNGSGSLGQVNEQQQQQAQDSVPSARPKSTEFSGSLNGTSPRPSLSANNNLTSTEAAVPAGHDSWASMVNTPLIPMFQKDGRMGQQSLDKASSKLNEWSQAKATAPGVPRMGDPTIHKRVSKSSTAGSSTSGAGDFYDDNGNLVPSSGAARNTVRNTNTFGNGGRSPALPTSSNRFPGGGGDEGGVNGLGMHMGGVPFGMGMGSPGLAMGLPGMQGLTPSALASLTQGGMSPLTPFNMNMLSAMGISPETQLLAAQMAANGFVNGFGQPGWIAGMQPHSAGVGHRGRGGLGSARSAGVKSPASAGGGSTPKGEDDVDPQLLQDIPAWLRSLRLHKYTPNFEGMKWQDMVVMDEAQLEAKGVAALGARRKMLKTFELVRHKMGIEGGPLSGVPTSATTTKSP
ncbi:hypothetical protein FISHEDRAFT_10151, partial [Fistulina hepatica ATCC 64428]